MGSQVDEWIGQASNPQKSQLQELRAIILALAPEATEALKWGQPCYTRKALFCYLQRAKTQVTLGFQRGALMSDPGKQMRHVRFESGEAIDTALSMALIEEALRLDCNRPVLACCRRTQADVKIGAGSGTVYVSAWSPDGHFAQEWN